MLRAILFFSAASLTLNAVVLYVLLHPRAAIIVEPQLSPTAMLRERRGGPASFEYVERATGRRLSAILPDDGARLAKFLREGKLSAEQEAGLRARYGERRREEVRIAEEMASAGEWNPARVQTLQREFWYAEEKRLPGDQAAGLSPEFFPPPGP